MYKTIVNWEPQKYLDYFGSAEKIASTLGLTSPRSIRQQILKKRINEVHKAYLDKIAGFTLSLPKEIEAPKQIKNKKNFIELEPEKLRYPPTKFIKRFNIKEEEEKLKSQRFSKKRIAIKNKLEKAIKKEKIEVKIKVEKVFLKVEKNEFESLLSSYRIRKKELCSKLDVDLDSLNHFLVKEYNEIHLQEIVQIIKRRGQEPLIWNTGIPEWLEKGLRKYKNCREIGESINENEDFVRTRLRWFFPTTNVLDIKFAFGF